MDHYTPRLTGFPDGRETRLPLLEPLVIAYLALVHGAGVAALAAAYNALLLRRGWLALGGLVIGAMSTVLFIGVMLLLAAGGVKSPALLLLGGRLVHTAGGILLAYIQRRHMLGHAFVGGRRIHMLGSVAAVFISAVVIPTKISLMLMGLSILIGAAG